MYTQYADKIVKDCRRKFYRYYLKTFPKYTNYKKRRRRIDELKDMLGMLRFKNGIYQDVNSGIILPEKRWIKLHNDSEFAFLFYHRRLDTYKEIHLP